MVHHTKSLDQADYVRVSPATIFHLKKCLHQKFLCFQDENSPEKFATWRVVKKLASIGQTSTTENQKQKILNEDATFKSEPSSIYSAPTERE